MVQIPFRLSKQVEARKKQVIQLIKSPDDVFYKIKGITDHHSWSGEPHYLSYFSSHIIFITMYLTIFTCRLILFKRAKSQPVECIISHSLAFPAQINGRMMFFTTIQANHTINRLLFIINLTHKFM